MNSGQSSMMPLQDLFLLMPEKRPYYTKNAARQEPGKNNSAIVII
jgi:hypothetical protein